MKRLNQNIIGLALEATARHLRAGTPFEILLVGGAAAVLSGLLPSDWTTADVDLMVVIPGKYRDEVLDAAADAGRELGLQAGWMNEDAGLFRTSLPEGWESRRVEVCRHGRLTVHAISRQDLIAMKFVAHRMADLQHLALLEVNADDIAFVREHLKQKEGVIDEGILAKTESLLSTWKVKHE